MYKKKQFFCMLPYWQSQVSKNTGAEIINDTIIIPPALGEGHAFFSQVIPGIAVLLMDFTLVSPLSIERFKEDTERYIFHFDLSDHSNILTFNGKDTDIGYTINLGLSILSNQTESFFKPSIGKRTFAIRIFIDKKLMNEFTNSLPNKKQLNMTLSNLDQNCYHGNIDSNSILLGLTVKEKPILDESFDLHLRGITLQLLGNFLNKYNGQQTTKNPWAQAENERLAVAKNYLLNNLHLNFPSISFLSKMAGMSATKFKILFKKQFNTTAKKIFIKEKMSLANKMLLSGDYKSLTEILNELHYNKLENFSSSYFEIFKRKPSEDHIKKNS
jgi:AraC-like DNA-binding protein